LLKKGGRGGKGQCSITFNKEYWKDKTCFNCGEKGHLSSSCTNLAVSNDDDSAFTFINTVSENKTGFMKRQIKDVENARSLYSKLNYPSWKDFKWIIRSNQIKDCPVTVEHVDTALKIWGKNVVALKGKITQTKPDPVARDFVKVQVELLKLHKEVYITANLFFVNKIPFFLTLSHKMICFTAINHLTDRTVPQIVMVFTMSNVAFALQQYMWMGNLHPSRF
jgi:hypothetical protein